MNTAVAAISQGDLAIIRLALDSRATKLTREARSRQLAGPENAALRRVYRDEAARCQLIKAGLLQLAPGTLIRVQHPSGGAR